MNNDYCAIAAILYLRTSACQMSPVWSIISYKTCILSQQTHIRYTQLSPTDSEQGEGERRARSLPRPTLQCIRYNVLQCTLQGIKSRQAAAI